ncbi:MAG: chromate transporter [Terrisporobacter othiniensis]|uniref:Chromate transporter n=1 Tax=Terrisporobacter hibernicus TaxID=2813371 RepID=A0AAX2ZE89_9FIRM|nr:MULTISPECIES: chromate transporter [Terrisporobacter]MDU4862298.1 chromate transporter [Terrisporobacter othiniensis]UPA28867.1 chromate transporter [Terrisporobacter glycolicus]MDU6993752.1 chromate transporter [Terrisporobacter othiniensis]UEL47634.1 chromate transporter [Terrisporobacter hibernicus]SFJ18543.1 chromate transporter [Terrisporobacter glycolicus]
MLLMKLFFSFLQVGLFSVGGGYAAIPLIQDQIVNVHGLMTLSEFTDLITIAEMTPGPISINSSTFVGTRLSGPFGATICTLGCIIPSFIICLTLAHFYYKYRDFTGVQTVLSSLRPAVVALIGSAGASILLLALFNSDIRSLNLGDFRIIELGIFVGCLYLLRKYKANAISIILGSGVVGTAIYLIQSAII